MSDYIQLVHLSDLHFSKKNENNPVYLSASDSIRAIKPDIIAVTGDIADNLLPELNQTDYKNSLGMAHVYFLRLCRDCGIDPEKRLFLVPGNHDYRYAGNIRTSAYEELFSSELGPYYRSRHLKIDGVNFIIVCIDSNTDDRETNFAEGLVTQHEFNKLREDLGLIRSDLGDEIFDLSHKIGMLHHHPLPIFRSEYTSGMADSFLSLKNSATLIRETIKNDINLLLHGHKHHRGLSKVSFPIGLNVDEFLGVVSAGSVGKATAENEYSFNLIRYHYDGRVSVKHMVQRGHGSFFSEPDAPHILIGHEQARKANYQKSIKKAKYSVDRCVCIDEIEHKSGDWIGYNYIEGLKPVSNKATNTIRQSIKSSGGLYTKKPQCKVIFPHGQTATWRDVGEVECGVKKGDIVFDFGLEGRSITYCSTEEYPNAISFTKEERRAALSCDEGDSIDVKRKSEFDYDRLYNSFKINYPKNFTWVIRFPEDYLTGDPRIMVEDRDGNKNYTEKEYCDNKFLYCEEQNSALLSIDYPKWGNRYSVVWDLQTELDRQKYNLTALEKMHTNNIKKYLPNLTIKESVDGEIGEWLRGLNEEAVNSKMFGIKNQHPKFPMELAISVFDDDIQRLRYVAFYCPKCDDIQSASVWDIKTRIGQPISGFTYKRKQFNITLAHDDYGAEFDKYIRRPSCDNKSNEKIQSFAAMPLFFPIGSDNVIGVFEIATCSNNDFIYKWDEHKDDKKKEAICNWANNRFFNFCKQIRLI